MSEHKISISGIIKIVIIIIILFFAIMFFILIKTTKKTGTIENNNTIVDGNYSLNKNIGEYKFSNYQDKVKFCDYILDLIEPKEFQK